MYRNDGGNQRERENKSGLGAFTSRREVKATREVVEVGQGWWGKLRAPLTCALHKEYKKGHSVVEEMIVMIYSLKECRKMRTNEEMDPCHLNEITHRWPSQFTQRVDH